ncbi:uncharacterized protein LOC121363788 isoform X2 [Pyrgilauda ruficollis]|uniref:uncharacterized protein LOC121363788 isoform X2 n=1 Tax=Pyrgilauda ruficollis TaxID=221976 RepID=UPI001B85E755|nr:uncharacterized protein LOC121363788 isoform X2 [Pyrgilauda ruficollis]
MGWTLIRVVPDALVSPHSDVLHKPPLSLRPTPPPCRRRVAPRRSHSCLCRVCDPCRRPLPVPRRTALPGCRLVRPRCSRLPQMPGLQHDRVLRCSPLARLLTRSAGDSPLFAGQLTGHVELVALDPLGCLKFTGPLS